MEHYGSYVGHYEGYVGQHWGYMGHHMDMWETIGYRWNTIGVYVAPCQYNEILHISIIIFCSYAMNQV